MKLPFATFAIGMLPWVLGCGARSSILGGDGVSVGDGGGTGASTGSSTGSATGGSTGTSTSQGGCESAPWIWTFPSNSVPSFARVSVDALGNVLVVDRF